MKICANEKCLKSGIFQPDENFHKNKQNSDGLHSYCKTCRNKSRAEYHNNLIKKRNKAGNELLEKAKKRVGLI